MLVSKAKLESYRRGSLEEFIENRHRIIRQWEKNANICTHLIVGNFEDHSIIMDKDGNTSKLMIKDGQVCESSRIVGPKVYATPKEFFMEQADRMVERMKKGLNICTEDIASLMMDIEPQEADLPVIEQLQAITKKHTLWDKFYREKLVEVSNRNWSQFMSLEQRNCYANEPNKLLQRCHRLENRFLGLRGVRFVNESVNFMILSTQETIDSIQHHLGKLSEQAVLGVAAHDLVECIAKIDHLVTYAECVRSQEV